MNTLLQCKFNLFWFHLIGRYTHKMGGGSTYIEIHMSPSTPQEDGGGVCTCRLFGDGGRVGPSDLYISSGSPICLYSGTFNVRLKAFAITTLKIF